MMLVQDILNRFHVGRRTYKAVGNEVDVFFDGQEDVAAIFLG